MQVTDWHEFWNYGLWEQESQAPEMLEDPAAQQEQTSFSARAQRRQEALLERLPELSAREGVINYAAMPRRNQHYTVRERPPMAEKEEDRPQLTDIDLRALVEKRKKKGELEALWAAKRKQLGKFKYATSNGIYHDVRIRNNVYERREAFSEEQVIV